MRWPSRRKASGSISPVERGVSVMTRRYLTTLFLFDGDGHGREDLHRDGRSGSDLRRSPIAGHDGRRPAGAANGAADGRALAAAEDGAKDGAANRRAADLRGAGLRG